MNKRQAHHLLTKLRSVSYWYFLVAFIISASVAVGALRHNNLTAVNLRNQLLNVDQQDGNVAGVLNQLRTYIYSHMNTNLSSGTGTIYPPIQLKYTYQRLEQAEINQVSTVNSQLYTAAENYCQATIPTGFSGRYRISCIESYITEHGVQVQPIPAALYEFDFVSPFWSPDLAGWSILASIAFLVLFVVRFVLQIWLKQRLKSHS
ncbi:MAG TPA: hypothetical protein VMR34_00460 [Candidatus Saccharimonadales bacterium]|nr:hypothetical protein [Candidatus Saccharimonadales bacterium]